MRGRPRTLPVLYFLLFTTPVPSQVSDPFLKPWGCDYEYRRSGRYYISPMIPGELADAI